MPSSRKGQPGLLPSVHVGSPSPKLSEDTVKSKEHFPKDENRWNNTMDTTKPLPARTPSTRFHEPAMPPSSYPKRNASNRGGGGPPNVQRSNTSATAKTTGTTGSQGVATTSEKPERPGLQRRRTTAQTRYIDMLLELDNVPKLHNILASLFTWILLAGYIVFPATFRKFQNDQDLDAKANNNLKAQALKTARNIPFLYVASFACGLGVFGCLWLWFKHRKNYVWVINRVFLPALMNSIAGLISTLINIYTAQDGQFSVTARATIIVTAACSVVTIVLFLLYNSIMLKIVKMRHERETKKFDKNQDVGKREEALVRSEGKDGAGAV